MGGGRGSSPETKREKEKVLHGEAHYHISKPLGVIKDFRVFGGRSCLSVNLENCVDIVCSIVMRLDLVGVKG